MRRASRSHHINNNSINIHPYSSLLWRTTRSHLSTLITLQYISPLFLLLRRATRSHMSTLITLCCGMQPAPTRQSHSPLFLLVVACNPIPIYKSAPNTKIRTSVSQISSDPPQHLYLNLHNENITMIMKLYQCKLLCETNQGVPYDTNKQIQVNRVVKRNHETIKYFK